MLAPDFGEHQCLHLTLQIPNFMGKHALLLWSVAGLLKETKFHGRTNPLLGPGVPPPDDYEPVPTRGHHKGWHPMHSTLLQKRCVVNHACNTCEGCHGSTCCHLTLFQLCSFMGALTQHHSYDFAWPTILVVGSFNTAAQDASWLQIQAGTTQTATNCILGLGLG